VSAVVKTIERKPDPDVVAYLEGALARARAGETVGVLILEQSAPNQSCKYSTAGLDDRFKVMGYLMHAIANLQVDD
jgi:hypothetical protein